MRFRRLSTLAVVVAMIGATLSLSLPAASQAFTCNGLAATIVGTEGRDYIEGTSGPDVIVALGGSDRIRGLGGDDVICAGAGRDRVWAGAGDDRVEGWVKPCRWLAGVAPPEQTEQPPRLPGEG